MQNHSLQTIDLYRLADVTGGCSGNTGITGGLKGIHNKVGTTCIDRSINTGITGGLSGINNAVPGPRDTGFNTGITGGLKGINNEVPAPQG